LAIVHIVYICLNHPSTVVYTLAECQKLIELNLAELKMATDPANLYDPIRYMLKLGGKRIRPACTLMAYNLFHDQVEPAVFPALAVEIFHNFTLMHDDIMDQSDMRRNQPTVHQVWNENIAILSGDAMMIAAYDLLARSASPAILPMLQLFNKTALEVCEGQQLDMDYESEREVSVSQYIRMIELKTAVLIGTALKLGAIAAGSEEVQAEMLYKAGKNLGLAFQLQDDLLDVYGKQEIFGKPSGNDIVVNKKTILLVKAIEFGSQKHRDVIADWFSRATCNREEKIAAIREIYDQLRLKDVVNEMIRNYYNLSLQALRQTGIAEDSLAQLQQLIQSLVSREK